MDGKVAIKGREAILNQINIISSPAICYVDFFAPAGDMRQPRKCHCTILMELKPTKERNSLGKMGKDVSTQRRRWDWFPYDLWGQPRITSKTTLAFSPVSRFVSSSSTERKKLQNEFAITNEFDPSYVWTSISAPRKLLLLGIRQKIHSGYGVKVWEDPWIPTLPARPVRSNAPILNPNMRVSDLINGRTKEWNVRLLENYFAPDDIPLIRSLAISPTHCRDTFC